MAETARAKASFTVEDVMVRAGATLERCVLAGTTSMRTHAEVDPVVGLRGFEGVLAIASSWAWAIDVEICVFAQDGLTNAPGTAELLLEALGRGATVLGGAPYADTDPRAQIDWVFDVARDHDVDIDLHLDLGEGDHDMQVDYVCERTEAASYGGRVTVGHMTRLSYAAPGRVAAIARRLADAGVAVTVLPATDLFLMGRSADRARPRGVLKLDKLRALGVDCSLATNNVLNPFTPYGDGSLVRLANLYANVAQVETVEGLQDCLDMITSLPAQMLHLEDYGLFLGSRADLVVLDCHDRASAIAELALPLFVIHDGQVTVQRPAPQLERPVTLPTSSV